LEIRSIAYDMSSIAYLYDLKFEHNFNSGNFILFLAISNGKMKCNKYIFNDTYLYTCYNYLDSVW